MTTPPLESKLPNVGTTIFTVMSRLAEQTGALNLGQGFPDFEPPAAFAEALARHVKAGRNQYAPMAGVPRLREQIAKKLSRDYGCTLDADASITVTDGATEGLFDAITCVVRPGDEVLVFDPCYDSYEPAVLLSGHHGEVAKWRRQQQLRRTLERRPDLLRAADLSAVDRAYLRSLGWPGDEQRAASDE